MAVPFSYCREPSGRGKIRGKGWKVYYDGDMGDGLYGALLVKDFDVLIILGAGDLDNYMAELAEIIKSKE